MGDGAARGGHLICNQNNSWIRIPDSPPKLKGDIMASIVEITCKCGCGRKKMVRTADVARGWGKFYSKSCKAKEQERRTGQYSNYLRKSQVCDGGAVLGFSDESGFDENDENFSNEDYFNGYGFGPKD